MEEKAKRCSRCSGAMEPAQRERVSAGEPPLRLSVLGLPLLRCPKGHAEPVHPDFMLWLLRSLRERFGREIPGGEAKGLLFKKYHCACGAQLPDQSEREGRFGLDFAFEGAPAFRVEVESPLYRCPACGREQVRSAASLASGVPQAIMVLHDAAGFPHSG
jgi:hypothetical protein